MRSTATGMLRKIALGTQGGVMLLQGQAQDCHSHVGLGLRGPDVRAEGVSACAFPGCHPQGTIRSTQVG